MNKQLLLSMVILLVSLPPAFAGEPLVYGEQFEHQSKVMQTARRYMVSLPEQYAAKDFSYPVLYIIDGDFQFHHVSNTVRHLARMGKLPQIIVVGVANQGPSDYIKSNSWAIKEEGVTKEQSEYGGVEKFTYYLHSELVPLIDKTYRTNQSRAISGYSFGGLYVMQEYLNPESPFNAFLAMSPSLWYDDYSYQTQIKERLEKGGNLKDNLFISLANEQGMGVEELVSLLKSKYEFKARWEFKNYPKETHYTTALPALYDGLQFLATNYFIDVGELMSFKSYGEALDAFAKKKALWSGFRFSWLQSYTFAKYFFGSKQTDKMDEALVKIKFMFPESYQDITINFALGFNRKKQHQESLNLLKSISDLGESDPKWQYQMSLALEGLGKMDAAKLHHKKAIQLAKDQKLESWEVWELQPDKKQGTAKT